ncbi:DDE-type integrase/transposase/recombinase [Paenibacillus pabuli]|uniref:DDE-type integrase/transposase/recombinase n=1 Tax=Paenibacillus pabuli TaxID=1472 RepID=UPI003D6A5850
MTYIRAGEHFVYLSVIQELCNNEIVAWHLSERNDLALIHETLDRLCQHTDLSVVILNSNQGFQYTSKPFNHKLKHARKSLQAWELLGQCLYRVFHLSYKDRENIIG